MMDIEVTSLPSASLPPVLSADNSSSSLDAKEPAINGVPHKHQLSDEQVDSSTMKTCDSSAENAEILTFKEDSVHSITPNKKSILEEGQTMASDEELVPTEITINKGSENSKGRADNAREIEIEENCKDQEKLDEEEEEMGEEDDEDAEGKDSTKKRPKRDVQRRSVFEMLQGEIHDEDDEYEDERDMDDEDHDALNESRVRKKRKNREDESELNLEELNDDDDNDEDFTADGHQKKSMKKKASMTKKEEKALVLFDDDDLPLKGKRSQGGRPKKKKAEDGEMPSDDEWHLTGRIKGKLFHDEDDDHENDIDDYSYRQQALSEKKVLTSSNKRSFDGSSKKQSCSKKIKIDVQGWKFSKPRDGMESKPKPRSSSGPSTQHQTSGHYGSGTSSSTSAPRHIGEDSYMTGSFGLQDDDLKRKQSILTIWEQKLRHLDRELEERVAVVRRNEGKILREERRLKELEAVLNYKEKLLNSCEEFLSGGNEDMAEKLACLKRDYEKYRRLSEEHRLWIEREHCRIEAHAFGRSFSEEEDSACEEGKEVSSQLPLLEQDYGNASQLKEKEKAAENMMEDDLGSSNAVKVDG